MTPDWYYLADKKRRGPVTLKVLLDYVLSQPSPHDVLVHRKGLGSWVPAIDVPQLASLLPPLPSGYKRPSKYKSRVGLGFKDATEDGIFFVVLCITAAFIIRHGILNALFAGVLNGASLSSLADSSGAGDGGLTVSCWPAALLIACTLQVGEDGAATTLLPPCRQERASTGTSRHLSRVSSAR